MVDIFPDTAGILTPEATQYLYGLEIPGFRYDRLWRLKDLVERITGVPAPAQEPVIGHNVFSHESGIHTHGVQIFRQMYEPIPYDEVGGRTRFVYGKHSGKNSLSSLLIEHAAEIDHDIDHDFVALVLSEIKRLCEINANRYDKVKFIEDYYSNLEKLGKREEDVIELAKELAKEGAVKYELHGV